MKTGKQVYVIDDEADICQLACTELERYGYETRSFRTGTQAMYALKKHRPEVCIIDLGLPDMDGLVLVRELVNECDIGIIILSGRDNTADKVLGLELGADDYISKPFDPRELVARTNSVLRRMEKGMVSLAHHEPATRQASFAGWTFDQTTLTLVHDQGHSETLSAAEADLLLSLLKSPRQVLSRDKLMKERDTTFDRCIDVRISRIRKKLQTATDDSCLIKTIYGAGYMFMPEVHWNDL
ncbi:MAG: DNA-binding response regulator, OmpR family, contains REC and winged-helix (WHTH) domain [uncultured Thiotrichaceae bacterium]|uniref:DNA-binding response regulator, OmpR family, contains REC and winged-helix (WHTH) domain n=1 Tax=uncultured Thiotrichaceae bacterium TaxID=298394 RepID=A0A6S6STR4_9GAMM|nr:MAG: DNA-binding response regulator, OmpR family, contains REC and winged-helix (WHTH) domain [uncultured Thiotrichaceae bacterium]